MGSKITKKTTRLGVVIVRFDLFVPFVLQKSIAHAEELDRVGAIGRGLRALKTSIF
jgi:hypothetical protein